MSSILLWASVGLESLVPQTLTQTRCTNLSTSAVTRKSLQNELNSLQFITSPAWGLSPKVRIKMCAFFYISALDDTFLGQHQCHRLMCSQSGPFNHKFNGSLKTRRHSYPLSTCQLSASSIAMGSGNEYWLHGFLQAAYIPSCLHIFSKKLLWNQCSTQVPQG